MKLHNDLTRLLVLLAAVPLQGGCTTPRKPAGEPDPDAIAELPWVEEDEPEPEKFQPRPVFTKGDDWIMLKSGEWLRGELSSSSRDDVVFDSEELDELKLDLDDIVELVTDQAYTLRLEDRSTVVGVPSIKGDRIRLTTPAGVQEFTRAQIQGFVRGKPTESNYWSGRVRLGGTVRSGNTDQVDTVFSTAVERLTAASRLTASFDSVFSETEGVETANNQAFNGGLDYYITHRFYARPLGLDVLRDRIQNIDLRIAPYSGVGYLLVDRSDMSWEMTGGLGYRATQFDSVPDGESDLNETATLVFHTDYTWELTKAIDLEFGYNLQAGLKDAKDTNHETIFGLTFEFIWDLDFNFRTVWRRVGEPEPDDTGDAPNRDDLRVEVGVSWSF